MPRGRMVLARMLVLGVVTAADMAAVHTQSQVHPGIAHLQAFFAAFGIGRMDFGGNVVAGFDMHDVNSR